MIAENLAVVHKRMADAALKSGRNLEDVRLVTVSKQAPDDKIREARKAGAVLFGENKIQEAQKKIEALGVKDFHWHFIGHLQKNKVKNIFGLFELIHSVDSIPLAELIHRGSLKHDRVTPILIQVNVSGEGAKSGVSPERLEETLREVSKFDGVKVQGLMTIPPYDPDPEKSRKHFARLRELRDSMNKTGIENIELKELSMGMSNDVEIAIEEGATLVRIGTAVFGPR